ncbi:MAG: hypothetical protein GYB65_22915 [Chloroflexi bacterium]|nr:hypothetical protein [Chloroflexota bacterium]
MHNPGPGTPFILRILTLRQHDPPYARRLVLWQAKRQHTPSREYGRLASRLVEQAGCCLGLLFIVGWAAVAPMSCRVINLILQASYTSWGLVVVLLVLLALPGIGAALTGISISRPIRRERARNTWDSLLLLPQPRHAIVLYTVAAAYNPQVFIIAVSMLEIVAVITAGLAVGWWFLVLCAALVVEGLQIMALSVSVGIISATGSREDFSLAGPVLYGMLLVAVRALTGALVAAAVGYGGSSYAVAVLLGPLCGLATSDGWVAGLVISAIYLLALEILVRRTFAWSITHAGET